MAYGRLGEAIVALKRGLASLRVDQINQAQWDLYAKRRVTVPRPREKNFKPRPVSAATLRREFNVLRAALGLAHRQKHLAEMPRLVPPADSAPRDWYLTKDEARRIVAAAETPHLKVFLAIALGTGARRTAILSLRWDQVDLIRGRIDFNEPGRKITAKKRAIVPIIPQLLTVLEQAAKVKSDCGFVVEYAGAPVPNGIRRPLHKACQKAGLARIPTPHILKHSVASWFAMDGVPIDQCADWLATDPKTLRRVYRKFDPGYLSAAGAALAL